ncbi:Holliday junction resolvase RuvX [Alkalibaculum sp. M08DMB]|uniref:Putative pre-16S rRNA nuclease n=1 Tax=Alkalibaculum sporogenes TaxID=2655001 RepID=A0A6A7KAC3_9FIRM|nr:Holliday junction resolvase RuvX [Alkalibaculum sporogenes]MPW26305.1 Holliday junction resolvase RuvX [Alkalibaculum sporogenes]
MKDRILSLDVGNKYIGIAVSDQLRITAQGVTTLIRKNLDEDLLSIKNLVEEYDAKEIVIGLPKNMNGTIGIQGNKTINFGNYLNKRLDCEIIYWDERLTSKLAENLLIEANVRREKRKNIIDKLAAQAILQSYIDSL